MWFLQTKQELKKNKCRDVAQPGSAPCSGRGGRKFKSCHPDHLKSPYSKGFFDF